MKIIFAGTPHFAEKALQALLEKKMEVVAVLTQPDRPSGRGMQLKPSPVKQLAIQNGLTVLQPQSLKGEETQQELSKLNADLMIVAAYGLILPKAVLQIPRFGCLNIHASILPRWRGAAPIQRAILAGDEQTGITIMQMDEGLDTGAILLKKNCPIKNNDTSESLYEKLAVIGAEAITEALDLLENNNLDPLPQENQFASYAAKITKDEALLDWELPAIELDRKIRGYNPFPGSSSNINGITIKIWQASIVENITGEPGKVIKVGNNELVVSCGKDALSLETIQKPNSKSMPIGQFLQGFKIKAGDCFTTA